MNSEQEDAARMEAAAQEQMEAQTDAERQAWEEAQLRELAERGDYIGDGVYATFDGYHIWLKCQRDGMEHSVALEPNVLLGLLRYVRHFFPTYGKDQDRE